MLCKNPPFTKASDSALCNEALVDQLWKLMNSGETHTHTHRQDSPFSNTNPPIFTVLGPSDQNVLLSPVTHFLIEFPTFLLHQRL